MVFMLESCVEIGITSSICLLMINGDRVSSFWEVFSTCLAFFFAGALVIAPLHVLISGIRVNRAYNEGDDEAVEENGHLFEGKNLESGLAVQHSTIFFVRRYILMFLVVFLPETRNTQITVQINATLLFIAFVMHSKPYTEPIMNKQEIANEVIVLLCSYLLLYYTEFVTDMEVRYNIGWVHMLLIGVNVLMNLSIMVVITVHNCKVDCRRRKAMAIARKTAEERKEKMQAKERDRQIAARIEQERRQRLINMFPDMEQIVNGQWQRGEQSYESEVSSDEESKSAQRAIEARQVVLS